MTCVIVGLGYFGKIIRSKLEKLHIPHYTCDPYVAASDFKNIRDVNVGDLSEIFWFVTTPASTHKSVIMTIVNEAHGRRIWVEKPVCMTYDETCELDAFLKEKGVTLYCDFTWLEHSFVKAIDETFVDGARPLFFKMKIVQPKMIDYTKNDACIVMDLAPHPVSIIQYIIERARCELVYISVYSVNIDKIAITGLCTHNFNFLIEFDNTTNSKYRTLDYVSSSSHLHWDTHTDVITCDGTVYSPNMTNTYDAIERNILRYMNNMPSNVDYLRVAHILETIMTMKTAHISAT